MLFLLYICGKLSLSVQIECIDTIYLCNPKSATMQKISISFLLFLTTICAFAQNEHVKFMGIPLNGNIQQFHQKLVAKGCRHDAKVSSMISKGTRAFKGTFAGKDADIYVYYDETSKIVYRAKAVITCNGNSIRDMQFNDFKGLLDTKYGTLFTQKDTQDGYDSYSYPVFAEQSEQMIGSVGIYVSENEYGYHEYSIHIDYYDNANLQKHERKRLDDI